ncbi:MAG: hypothetical protein ISR91_06785 [Candidatus Delongbacteria bacterium]|nr:hypothetical protein [Candidatus Delongbacteria bacterium]
MLPSLQPKSGIATYGALLSVLCLLQSATAQILVRPLLPECGPPATPLVLAVEIRLEPGDSLKVYDLRLCFDTTRVTPDESQIQEGSWFTNSGPTYFWHQYQSGELIVNGAILGPGLAATGNGTIFSLPLEFTEEGVTAIDIKLADLYNAQAQLFTSVVTLPANIQVPCRN